MRSEQISTSTVNPLARSVTFDDNSIWVTLADGRVLGVPLAYFPRLLNATPQEREAYIISGGGTGLHWEELDEDISVAALFQGIDDMTTNRTAQIAASG